MVVLYDGFGWVLWVLDLVGWCMMGFASVYLIWVCDVSLDHSHFFAFYLLCFYIRLWV